MRPANARGAAEFLHVGRAEFLISQPTRQKSRAQAPGIGSCSLRSPSRDRSDVTDTWDSSRAAGSRAAAEREANLNKDHGEKPFQNRSPNECNRPRFKLFSRPLPRYPPLHPSFDRDSRPPPFPRRRSIASVLDAAFSSRVVS